MQSEEQFFQKLGEIPVLNHGWAAAWGYYSKVRDYSSVTKFTLGVTEMGVKKAAALSAPVVSHFQPQIDTVNNYACSKLNEIESKYPLIRQPSEQIKEACAEYVQPVVGRVKPVVTYVQGVVDSSKKQVEKIKTYSTNMVVGACDLGVNTVSHAVNVTFDTIPGRLVTRTVDGVLTFAEGLVDKYIPEEPQQGHSSKEEIEKMEPGPQRVAVHFTSVSRKVRERMFRRAMRDYRNAKVRTMDTINKLHSAVDLIDYTKKNIGGALARVEELWTWIADTSDQPIGNNESSSALNVEERIILIGRTLVHQLRSGITVLEYEAGQFVRHPISTSIELTDFVYQISSNIKNFSVEKARANLQAIQAGLKVIIDNVDVLGTDSKTSSVISEEEDLSPTEISEEDESDTSASGNPESS